MHYEGPIEDAPIMEVGWAQREALPSEQAPNQGSGLSGLNTEVVWRPARGAVEVAPVITGHDYLRDEPIVDVVATQQKQLEVDLVRRGLWPQPTKDEHWQRHLKYLREHVPEQYQEWIQTHPEDALQGFPPVIQEAPVQPVEEPVIQEEQPQEQDQLEGLLKAKAAAEKAGNETKLAEIQRKIAELTK